MRLMDWVIENVMPIFLLVIITIFFLLIVWVIVGTITGQIPLYGCAHCHACGGCLWH